MRESKGCAKRCLLAVLLLLLAVASAGEAPRGTKTKLVATRKKVKAAPRPESGVSLDLTGRWRENQYRRRGLNDLLYSMGMSWWKRLYVTSTSWENEQTIFQKGNVFRINGFKGPQAEVYSYTLTADNSTVSLVTMGDVGGGALRATASLEGAGDEQALVARMESQETGQLEIVQKWTRKKDSKMMVLETRHAGTDAALRSVYYKQ